MTPEAWARLMAEVIPTRPAPPPEHTSHADSRRPWTPAEQAQHRSDLETALEDWHFDDEREVRRREKALARKRHLRLIKNNAA